MKLEKLKAKGEEKKYCSVMIFTLLLFTFHLSLFILCFSVEAAQTATSSQILQLQSTAFRFDSSLMTSQNDPHQINLTDGPYHMIDTMADTQFGRNVPTGFSQAGFQDLSLSSGVADFQSVTGNMTVSPANAGARVRQLQMQIQQNNLAAGYQFTDQFGVTSTGDASGNLTGDAQGTFRMTQTYLVAPGVARTTVCSGTFTYSSGSGFILTSGIASDSWKGVQQGTQPGCVTQ